MQNILDLIPPPNPLPSTTLQSEAKFNFSLVGRYICSPKEFVYYNSIEDKSENKEPEENREQLYNLYSKNVVYDREYKGYLQYEEKTKYMFTLQDLKDYANYQSKWRWNILDEKEDYYVPLNEDDSTLIFESRFESGNLGVALKVSDSDYELTMQNDSLTKGHTQCKILLEQ